MKRRPARLATCVSALVLAGCASRAVDVKPLPANPADFATWDCARIDDEADTVQQRAAEVAYAVDELKGNNVVALGLGLSIFWPAMLAMRPDGLEAAELARLKGRYEALQVAGRSKGCPPPGADLPPAQAAALPVTVGDLLVYEDRWGSRSQPVPWVLRLVALRRDEVEFSVQDGASGTWRQDRAGNVTASPAGTLAWHRLLRRGLDLGQVLAGELAVGDDALSRARVRGQVVATGPQMLADRRFDAAVIELFGDVQRGDASTRLDGALVVDRASGVLLRLDLRSGLADYSVQRRLVRVDHTAP